MPDPLTYQAICGLAQELGCGRESLLALAPDNDPFYAGRGDRQTAAEWFAGLWEQFQFPAGVHLRRIHYVLVSQKDPVLLPKGQPYVNTIECWKYLGRASVAARFLHLVPASAFVDRRADDPIIHLVSPQEQEFEITMQNETPNVALPDQMPSLPSLELTVTEEPVVTQPYHVEVWCEKTTMNGILEPLAEEFGANLITGAGELSITACLGVVSRALESKRPVRILYVSDFDPAGQSMPVAVSRKVEFEVRSNGYDRTLDIQLRPIVLTAEQCVEYELPRTPMKESERRAARFAERFGEGATELDALEALHPGALRQILIEEIERYYDPALDDAVAEAGREFEEEAQQEIERVNELVQENHADEIALLEAEWERIAPQIRAWCERAQPLWQTMAEELAIGAPQLPELDLPEPQAGDEDEDPLYDSTRSYLDQLERYKAFQGKDSPGKG